MLALFQSIPRVSICWLDAKGMNIEKHLGTCSVLVPILIGYINHYKPITFMPISRWLSQNLGESSLASAALGLQQKGISSPSSTRPGHGIPLCGVPRLANFKLL